MKVILVVVFVLCYFFLRPEKAATIDVKTQSNQTQKIDAHDPELEALKLQLKQIEKEAEELCNESIQTLGPVYPIYSDTVEIVHTVDRSNLDMRTSVLVDAGVQLND